MDLFHPLPCKQFKQLEGGIKCQYFSYTCLHYASMRRAAVCLLQRKSWCEESTPSPLRFFSPQRVPNHFTVFPSQNKMSKLDQELLGQAVDKILAFSKGETVDGKKGKVRGFNETIELQVRPSISALASRSPTNWDWKPLFDTLSAPSSSANSSVHSLYYTPLISCADLAVQLRSAEGQAF